MTESPSTSFAHDDSDRPLVLIGAGVMGEAVLAAALRDGRPADTVVVSDRSQERLTHVTQTYGVRTAEPAEAVAGAGVVLLAVKPQDAAAALEQIAPALAAETVVVSLAAGLTTDWLQERLPKRTPVVRAMPNTPALVGEGMTVLSPGQAAGQEHLAQAEQVMATCGQVLTLPERYLDTVTAISGSGPAYVFYVVEAMVEAGVLLGLPREHSTQLAVQTLAGAAALLRESGDHPSLLRERVSSPGGTTVAGLRALDREGVRSGVVAAVESAARRSAELAREQA